MSNQLHVLNDSEEKLHSSSVLLVACFPDRLLSMCRALGLQCSKRRRTFANRDHLEFMFNKIT